MDAHNDHSDSDGTDSGMSIGTAILMLCDGESPETKCMCMDVLMYLAQYSTHTVNQCRRLPLPVVTQIFTAAKILPNNVRLFDKWKEIVWSHSSSSSVDWKAGLPQAQEELGGDDLGSAVQKSRGRGGIRLPSCELLSRPRTDKNYLSTYQLPVELYNFVLDAHNVMEFVGMVVREVHSPTNRNSCTVISHAFPRVSSHHGGLTFPRVSSNTHTHHTHHTPHHTSTAADSLP